jgi:hypothetical protein
LQGTFHNRPFNLQHYRYDNFDGSGVFQGVKFSFSTGQDGKVNQVVASIPNAGQIIFSRKQ